MQLSQQRTLYTFQVEGPLVPDPESHRMCSVLDKAIRDGGLLRQTIVQLHLCGTARSGKTSLIRRLMSKKAREHEPSTGVVDKAVRVDIDKSSIVVETTHNSSVWREIKTTGEESTLLLTGMRENMSEADTFVTEYEFADIPSTECEDREHKPYQLQPEENFLDSSVDPIKVFEKAIFETKDDIRRIQDPLSIYITDIGGQHEFQELIPALISGPSIFLIVVPAHWGLDNTFPIKYVHQSGKSNSYQASMTLKEHVLQTIATVMCVGEQEKSSDCPKLLFVLTFKDKVNSEELAAVEVELKDAVMSTKAFELGMIEFASEDCLCHSINNLSEDDNDVRKIQKTIERVSQRTSDYDVKTPYSWQFFGITLRSLSDNIVSYNTCLEIGKRCGISSREDLNKALVHFHEQTGVLRYYHTPELQDKVVLNPQVLFDMVSKLISHFTFEQVGKFESENFYKRGIFSLKTLEKMMPVSSVSCFTAKQFIAFLIHHQIIAPLKEMNYLLPCILPRTEMVVPSPSLSEAVQVVPLLISFEGGYIPRGLFGFMIPYLLEKDPLADFKMEQFDNLYRNEISFVVDPFGDEIKFSLHPSHIQIDVTQYSVERSVPIDLVCFYIKDRVLSILNKTSHKLYRSKHELAFLCRHSNENDHPADHPALVKMYKHRPEKLQCTLTKKFKDFPDECCVWFDKSQDIEPTLAQLQQITTKSGDKIKIIMTVAPKWEKIGAALDFDKTGSQLSLIQKQCGDRNPEECCKAVFVHWLKKNGRQPYTWQTIFDILQDVEYTKLAQEVRCAVLSDITYNTK